VILGWSVRKPNFIDRHIGARLRNLRRRRAMAAETLAQALAISPERLADFEEGRERISAELMRKMSRILRAPVSEFFLGLAPAGGAAPGLAEPPSPQEEERQLLRDFGRIRDAGSRALILALVAAYAEYSDPTDG
jgi:transcriptional regulator with XRE-family HTH domain